MLTKKLQSLFQQYLQGFRHYDPTPVSACYHLPCTLNTPDQIIVLTKEQELLDKLVEILAQLRQAQVTSIVANNASYTCLTDTMLLVCIDWYLYDENQQIFTDFSAFYYLAIINDELKIVNVMSHELNNSLVLDTPFKLED